MMKRLVYLLVLTVSLIKADDIVIAADDWCPINCEPNTQKPGYMVEIAQTIFKKAGHNIIYKIIPWTRAKKLTKVGRINGIIGSSYETKNGFIFPKNELGSVDIGFFTKKQNNWRYENLSSLSNVTLGVVEGYSYGTKLDTYLKENHKNKNIQTISGADVLKRGIKKLKENRVDTIVEAVPIFLYTTSTLGIQDKFRLAGVSGKPDKIYIAFSPKIEKSKEYAQILSDGIAKLRKSGELKKILAKYNLEDWR